MDNVGDPFWDTVSKNSFLEFFGDFKLRRTFEEWIWIFAEIIRDNPKQPAYETKLMLSRVSWALA